MKKFKKRYEKEDLQEYMDIKDFWVNHMLSLKNTCKILLDVASKNNNPKNPMDAMMEIEKSLWKKGMSKYEFANLIGVSRVMIGEKNHVHNISNEPKCQRCWRREETTEKRSDGGLLCNRCAHVIGV